MQIKFGSLTQFGFKVDRWRRQCSASLALEGMRLREREKVGKSISFRSSAVKRLFIGPGTDSKQTGKNIDLRFLFRKGAVRPDLDC
jgi:hypothetical protein